MRLWKKGLTGKSQSVRMEIIMAEWRLKVPVVLITYKRLDTTKLVMEKIRQAKPEKLYLISDGPKTSEPTEMQRIQQVRDYMNSAIDWDCDVICDYSEVNQGCKTRIVSGLDNVFKNEECAIIIEDDVLVHDTFFRFCQEMLEYYKDDENIGVIQAMNLCPDYDNGKQQSYYFSRYVETWGWATWKRVWKTYRADTPDYETLRDNKVLEKYWDKWYGGEVIRGIQRVEEGKLQAWDYQFWYTIAKNRQLSIIPAVNLAHNIGFEMSDATHTNGKCIWNFADGEIEFPLALRRDYEVEYDWDKLFSDTYYKKNLVQVAYGFVMSHILDFLKDCGLIKGEK